MANTAGKVLNIGNGHMHTFTTASAGTSETLVIGAGKTVLGACAIYTSGTATAPTFAYSGANVTAGGLTATAAITFAVFTD